ncbi:MAG: TlpA family protein disulfide reductase [Promethearchaeota archaeon]
MALRNRIAVIAVAVVLVVAVIGLTLTGIFPLKPSIDTTTETYDWTDRDLIDRGLYVPDWSFEMVGNYTLTMNELRNRVTVLDFMAISCLACETQNGHTKSLYEELGSTVNIISLTVSMSDTLEELEAYASNRSLTWPHGIDTDMEAAMWCGMSVVPMIVIIDAEGLLRWIHDAVWEFSGPSGMNVTVHQILS